MNSYYIFSEKSIILELGCGVGLTGIIATTLLRPILCIVTDLSIVVDKITKLNLHLNSSIGKSIPRRSACTNGTASTMTNKSYTYCTMNNGHSHIVAVPLCWGHIVDEEYVSDLITMYRSKPLKRKNNNCNQYNSKVVTVNNNNVVNNTNSLGYADIILVGDVAYQHYPGAVCHYDELILNVLQFSPSTIIIIFGSRIRMPASIDLLHMFLQHYDEICIPAVSALEINKIDFPLSMKHDMAIHIHQRKKL